MNKYVSLGNLYAL